MVSLGGRMIKLSENELIYRFTEHKKWIDSLGKEGKRLNFDEIDLSQNNIECEIYEQAYITDCIFDNRDIKDISFYLSKLCSSSFKRCNLEKVDFTKADLSYTDFTNSILCDMNFNKCECIETDFSNSQLSNIKLTDVLFDTVDLRNVIIQNVDVSYSSFHEVLVKGISLKNVIGIEKINRLSINIGDIDKSVILYDIEAIQWLKNNIRD